MEVATSIKAGYKQSELGVIPENWEATSVGNVVSFSGGTQPPRSTFRFMPREGFERLIQIRDYKTDDFETYIPEALVRKRCTKEDIMIGRYGPPIFQILRGIEGSYNVALIKTIPSAQIDREYLYYVLKQENLFQLIESLSRRSSGQTGVEMPALKGFGLPLPSLPEQRIIASALSDLDKLVEGLEKLVSKKHSIKQGAMQQLLTGKKRLPGFNVEWEYCEFKDIWQKLYSKSKISSGDGSAQGDYVLFVSGEENKRIDVVLYKNTEALIFSDGGFFNVRYFKGDFSVTDHCVTINLSQNNQFYYFWLTLNQRYLDLTTFKGSGLRNLNKNELAKVVVPRPSLQEQIAISNLLSDLDSEIKSLEQKRDKYAMLKQGMMQQLLTGKIRII